MPDTGTLLINGTQAPRYQGVFRCLADNRLGTALSRQARLIAESECCSPPPPPVPLTSDPQSSSIMVPLTLNLLPPPILGVPHS